MDATGTVECIAPAFTEPVINQEMIDGNFACYPHVVDGLYVTLGFVSSGGVVLRWYRDTFAQAEIAQAAAEGRDVYDLLMEELPDSPGTAMVLPHFTGSGTPSLDLESKGAIVGLTLSTTKGELIKAILEGISYEIKQNLTMLQDAGDTYLEENASNLKEATQKKLRPYSEEAIRILADVLSGPQRSVYQAESSSSKGKFYTLEVIGTDISCDCPGFTHRGSCRHVRPLKTALVNDKPLPKGYTEVSS